MPRAFLVKKTTRGGSFVGRYDESYCDTEILHTVSKSITDIPKSVKDCVFQQRWPCVLESTPSYPVFLGQGPTSKRQIHPNIFEDETRNYSYGNYGFRRHPTESLSNLINLKEPTDLSGPKSRLPVSPTSAFDRVKPGSPSSPPSAPELRNQTSMRGTGGDPKGSPKTVAPFENPPGLWRSHHDAASVFHRGYFGSPTPAAAIHLFAVDNFPYHFKDVRLPRYVDLMKEHGDSYFNQEHVVVYPTYQDDPTKSAKYDLSPKYTSAFPKDTGCFISGQSTSTSTVNPQEGNFLNISPKIRPTVGSLDECPFPRMGYPHFGRAQKRIGRQPILGVEYTQNTPSCQDRESPNENKNPSSKSDMRERQITAEKGQKPSPVPGPEDFQNKCHDLPKQATAAPVKPAQPKKYICDVCGKGFSRSNTLVTHKRIHTGDKPFECELCGRAFRQPGNLTRHRLTHTTVKPYVCQQCGKAFNRASNLSTHMRTHTDYKPFICQYCGKGFHQKIDMKIHSYTHTGEKPHKCKKCGRGFKQLTHLTYHMRTHSDVKMYTCTYCGKGFNQKGNLQAHIYGHTGERPYHCEICNKGFTLSSTLNTHRRTHNVQKPYTCQYCGKDCYQKNALKRHMLASHSFNEENVGLLSL